jgi:predicted Zn-dependent protease
MRANHDWLGFTGNNMHRRHLLFVLPFCLSAKAQNQRLPLASPVDAVNFYIIPTDDVAEQAAGSIARALTTETGLWIKSTMWTPSDITEPLAGTNQFPAEDYFPMGAKAARTLSEVSPRTYFIVLTNRDINSKSRNFRFQYSMHSPMANTSVLSFARLQYTYEGSPASHEVVAERVAKMLLRIIGEMRLGWKRGSDPSDLMYAPIMSIDDIDRMSLTHTIKTRKQRN